MADGASDGSGGSGGAAASVAALNAAAAATSAAATAAATAAAATAAAAAASAPAADDDPLVAFLAYLGRNGFQTGLRELLRAQELMLALLSQDRLPAEPVQRLALIQPLVCRNVDQQRQFGALLARWAPPLARTPRWRKARGAAGTTVGAAPHPLRRWPLRLKWTLAALAALLALGLAAAGWQYCALLRLCPVATLPPLSEAPVGADAEAGAVTPSDATGRSGGSAADTPPAPLLARGHLPTPADAGEAPHAAHAAFWLNLAGGLAMLILLAMVAMLLLRRLALQPLRTDAPLEQRTLFAPQARLLRKVPPLLRRVSRELRRPRRTDRLELDLGQTIAATVRGGGAFAPRWRSRSGTPEYVVLIDQRGPHDQLARAAEDIVAALDHQGVALHPWRFNGDPSLCQPLRLDGRPPDAVRDALRGSRTAWQRPGTGPLNRQPADSGASHRNAAAPRRRVRLGELATRSAGQRLLVFADAAQLIDPLTGGLRDGLQALSAFGATMLFTPMPVPGWGAAEQALAQRGVLVLPLQLPGLASGADWLSSQRALLTLEPDWPSTYPPRLLQHGLLWLARADAPPPAELDALLFELQLYLGPRRFQWLCGCAAFPVPSWPVTLVLAPLFLAPGDDVVTGAVALASLPWLREGSWPGWLREALQQRLSAPEAEAVARELRRRLDAASLGRPTEPADALAEVALALGPLARLRRWRAQGWRRFATDAWLARGGGGGRLRRDVLFLGFIQRGVAQRLIQRVPERLRRQVFREGVPLLGLRPWLPAAALMLAVAGIVLQLPPLRDRVEAALDNGTSAGPLPEVARFALPGRRASALAFSPDGAWLAVGFVDGGLVMLRRDGTLAEALNLDPDFPIRRLQFSGGGQALLSLHEQPLVSPKYQVVSRAGAVHQVQSQEPNDRDPFAAVALSNDGTVLAEAVRDRALRLVTLHAGPSTGAGNAPTALPERQGPRLHAKPVLLAAPGAQAWLVSTGLATQSGVVGLDAAGGGSVVQVDATGRGRLVTDPAAIYPSAAVGASGSTAAPGDNVGATAMGGTVTAMAVDATRGKLAVARGRSVVWLSLKGGAPEVAFNDLVSPAQHLAIRPDGQALLASLADGSVRLLPITGSRGAGWTGDGTPRRAEFSADGTQVIGFGLRNLVVWPATGGPPLRQAAVGEGTGLNRQPVAVGALSPDGRQVAVLGADGAVRLLGERVAAMNTGPWRLAKAEPAASAASTAAAQAASAAAAAASRPASSAGRAVGPYPAEVAGIVVPDVVGLSDSAALAALKRAGLQGRWAAPQNNAQFCNGTVLAQDPTAAERLAAGAQVQLTAARNSTEDFTMTCRGDLLDVKRGATRLPGVESLSFTMRAGGEAPARAGLRPGQCAWDDRAFRPGEPLRVDLRLHTTRLSQVLPALASADRYVVIRAANSGEYFSAGCVLSTDAKPPGPPQPAAAVPAGDPTSLLAEFFPAFRAEAEAHRRGAQMLAAALAPDDDLLALALALVKTEAGGFEPRTEQANATNTNTGGQPFDRYEGSSALIKSLGNQARGDGARYRGRGLLMIVGRANYARYGQLAGLGDQLVREPELAADFKTAIQVLVAAVKEVSPRLPRPLDAQGVRIAQRAINGSGTEADRLVREVQAAKPLATALLAKTAPDSGAAGAAEQTYKANKAGSASKK